MCRLTTAVDKSEPSEFVHAQTLAIVELGGFLQLSAEFDVPRKKRSEHLVINLHIFMVFKLESMIKDEEEGNDEQIHRLINIFDIR